MEVERQRGDHQHGDQEGKAVGPAEGLGIATWHARRRREAHDRIIGPTVLGTGGALVGAVGLLGSALLEGLAHRVHPCGVRWGEVNQG